MEKVEIVEPASNALAHLDDLAIVVLFSVFEARVRGTVLDAMEIEHMSSVHPIIDKAIAAARERVSDGSFFGVLDAYKAYDKNLIEEVNQVRRYRNWVAHGRRNEQPPFVSPDAAYQRLKQFLDLCAPAAVVADDWLGLLRDVGD